MQRKKIYIIGVGGIGSRHLQALKAVKSPLEITAVDRSEESLCVAKDRFEAMPEGTVLHQIEYRANIPKGEKVAIAIIATTSSVRAALTKELLEKSEVKYLILEKLLFQKKNDYDRVGGLLESRKVKTWVNCNMRMVPFYRALKKEFQGQKITYILHGNQSGLLTDLTHHLDFIMFLTGAKNFSVRTGMLDKKTKASKRKGHLELTGTLHAEFDDGSVGLFRCDTAGATPKIIEILSHDRRYIIREPENKAFVSLSPEWQWEEVSATIPYQSQMTTLLVEGLLAKGICTLPSYEEASQSHLQALEPLRKFLNSISSKKYTSYPFT
ncbi:MAG: hypothetical protein A3D67_02870 [Candidatus Lloydbacteria bacterium RIFCSPHIGHO2_02_FULL_51_22]|uniref:Gfo/Idh/MocA-like oxidoreductase N-terminal domain-containing protein n=2 Tax=Candidatus Lloydiibacteriota TaxID=1817910 RepID=A0A1G2DGI8_9BACT|nr:MAG: hypothetical protein A3D67_02870 [Candidatus Lloydbacteria bacterium RIFCSPHIGHO2_02_FULL_51_22]OGZ15152.1 MAG: hypothetical protein A3J08_02730 [Candidatus Lloydbacteria bacterium RIFCSPLOWO2_02_FULL_51_11]